MSEEIKRLKSALQRIARVHDWCSSGMTSLPNVAKDMRECIKEVESVILRLDRDSRKIERQDQMFRFLNHKKMVSEFNKWREEGEKP